MKMMLKFLPKNYYVYVAVFTGYIGMFLSATFVTWTSAIMPKLSKLEDNPLGRTITSTEQTMLVSIPVLVLLVGAFFFGYLAKKFGRKPILIILGVPMLLTYVFMLFATEIWHLYIARALNGIVDGGAWTVNTMYFAEVASASNRGRLGTAMHCFGNFGYLFVVILGPLTSYFWYHVILSVIPVVYMVLVYALVPESPYYLVQEDVEEAEVSLQKLRGTNNVTEELKIIKDSLEKDKQVGLKNALHSKALRKGLFIGGGLIIFQQLCGHAIILSYCQIIFAEADEAIASDIGPMIVLGVQFIVGFITPSFIDTSGRKMLLIISHIGIAVAALTFGGYFFMKDRGESVSSYSWLPLVSLMALVIFFELGVGSIPWAILGEIFSWEVKEAAASTCLVMCAIFASLVLVSFDFIKQSIGMGPTFWIFSASGVFAVVFVQLFVIETKGKTLKEIQEILNA